MMRSDKLGALPLPIGERVGVRGQGTLDRHVPPHPDRFATQPMLRIGVLGFKNGGRRPPMPLSAGERWSKLPARPTTRTQRKP